MLMGHIDGLPEHRSSKNQLLEDPVSELEEYDENEEPAEKILYSASFEELASNSIQYDTVIWLSISLLLVLAWGVGVIMLLYIPIRRYVLHRDLCSRKLYVTPTKIVYKVSRPSYIPFCGTVTIQKEVPLSLVLDIIVEQGCLQSVYQLHTFRIESIARGKTSPVDELQLQGISNPILLRKVIITEASKVAPDLGRSWRTSSIPIHDRDHMDQMGAVLDCAAGMRSTSKGSKVPVSPFPSAELKIPGAALFNKLEEVNQSVKKLELLLEKSHGPLKSS